MRVLVACEESQAVCIAFRERGHEAYSCDILRHRLTADVLRGTEILRSFRQLRRLRRLRLRRL